MKQDNTPLSPQEIVKNMTPMPWIKSDNGFVIIKSNRYKIRFDRAQAGAPEMGDSQHENLMADIQAITTSVSNTYGKGLNPEVYEDVVKLLEEIGRGEAFQYSRIDKVIKTARI